MTTSIGTDQVMTLLSASSQIGAALSFQERMKATLEAVRALVPGGGATAGVLKLDRRRASVVKDQIYTSGCPEEQYLAYVRDMIRVDPMRPLISAATGSPERLSDHQARCTPGFERFLRNLRVRSLVGWSFSLGQEALLVVSILRSEEQPDFSNAEMELARVAARLLEQAARHTALTNEAYAALSRGQEGGPLIALDSTKGLVHADVGAEAALRLQGPNAQELVSAAKEGREPRLKPGPGAQLRLVPLTDQLGGPRLFSVEVEQPPGQAVLAKYKLGPRQHQIASLLVDGLKYGEIAITLDVGIHTVKRAAEAIYKITGVPSRAALSKLALSSPKRRGRRGR